LILETQRLWSEAYTALAEEIEKLLLKRSFDNAAQGGGMQAEEETRARIANQLEQRAALNAQFKLLIENPEP
jgi:predicted metal-dependent phosphoesterase TrpH